jgi:hypothetical protein
VAASIPTIGTAGQAPPDHLTKAIEAVKSLARAAACEKSIERTHAPLWIFGDAVGAACWRKGYDTCKQEMTPAPDKVRVELSMDELLHLSWRAHLGFKKMIPNDRGIEMHRFSGEDDACGKPGDRAAGIGDPGEAPSVRRSARAIRQPARADSELVAVAA